MLGQHAVDSVRVSAVLSVLALRVDAEALPDELRLGLRVEGLYAHILAALLELAAGQVLAECGVSRDVLEHVVIFYVEPVRLLEAGDFRFRFEEQVMFQLVELRFGEQAVLQGAAEELLELPPLVLGRAFKQCLLSLRERLAAVQLAPDLEQLPVDVRVEELFQLLQTPVWVCQQ